MYRRDRCLIRLDEVLEAAADPVSAYLVRTRLQRLLTAVPRMIREDFPPPEAARDAKSPHTPAADRISALVDAIVAESRHLAQRSESLDARWEEGWLVLRCQLEELRAALISLGPSPVIELSS